MKKIDRISKYPDSSVTGLYFECAKCGSNINTSYRACINCNCSKIKFKENGSQVIHDLGINVRCKHCGYLINTKSHRCTHCNTHITDKDVRNYKRAARISKKRRDNKVSEKTTAIIVASAVAIYIILLIGMNLLGIIRPECSVDDCDERACSSSSEYCQIHYEKYLAEQEQLREQEERDAEQARRDAEWEHFVNEKMRERERANAKVIEQNKEQNRKIKEKETKKETYSYPISYGKSSSYPDCDDYDSFDDFMDDWEGRMPDGSNAEDYWDNW